MGLKEIHIKNYKSIRDYRITLKQMNLLLGENGSGKTNILSAIIYFYENMITQRPSYQVFDENNPLNDQVEITMVYDMSKILIRSRRNRKEGKETYLPYYKMIESIQQNGKVALTMTQIKGGRVMWNLESGKRKVLYHLYPLYRLDAREINLVDWEELWGYIGDFIKPRVEVGKELQEHTAAEKEEKREKYFLTEHHANAFFARILILVEGETELELLQNPYLRQLFPVLKQIIKGMSDRVIYRIVDATARRYNVPMAALLDMDKILEWDEKNLRMKWKEDYQFVAKKRSLLLWSKEKQDCSETKKN